MLEIFIIVILHGFCVHVELLVDISYCYIQLTMASVDQEMQIILLLSR